jgi:hypothetical protein
MPYNLPDFNETFQFWEAPTAPPVGAPAGHFNGQLFLNSRINLETTPLVPMWWVPPLIIRAPVTHTPGNGWIYLRVGDAPSGCYLSRWWDRCHLGFPNEYIVILVEQALWPSFAP